MIKGSVHDHTGLIMAAVLAALAGAVWVFAIDPSGSPWYPLCVFHALTGLHCPGCGCLRAAHALLHGRLADALAFNSLFVIGVPLAAILWAWNRCRARPLVARPAWVWWLVGVLLVFGVARNVPVYPFNLLAPHARFTNNVDDAQPHGRIRTPTSRNESNSAVDLQPLLPRPSVQRRKRFVS